MQATRRAWGVLALGLASVVAALVTGRDLYYHLIYLLTAVLLSSGLWAWAATHGLHLSRYTRSTRAQVGHPLMERFSLRNSTWLPKLWVAIYDDSDVPGHRTSRVIYKLGPHQERVWTVRTLCERRGRFRLGPVSVSGGDPLGLFEFRREFPQTSSIVVYPATVPIRDFPQRMGYLPGGDALRRRTYHVTTNAAGVREYVPGDSFNRIHWPSTARKNRLIVKEFELDPLADVWILLDMAESVHFREPVDEVDLAIREQEPWQIRARRLQLEPSTEEYAVTAAASVAEFFIRRGRAVGLIAYGQRREVIQADRDERQLGKILDAMAVLRAAGDMPFSQVLSAECGRLTRGTIVIAISPSVHEEWARTTLSIDRAGLRMVAILVDAAGFGGPEGASLLKEQLLSTGTPAILLRQGDSIRDVLSSVPRPRNAPVLPAVYTTPDA